jgi:hypothetical protein
MGHEMNDNYLNDFTFLVMAFLDTACSHTGLTSDTEQ